MTTPLPRSRASRRSARRPRPSACSPVSAAVERAPVGGARRLPHGGLRGNRPPCAGMGAAARARRRAGHVPLVGRRRARYGTPIRGARRRRRARRLALRGLRPRRGGRGSDGVRPDRRRDVPRRPDQPLRAVRGRRRGGRAGPSRGAAPGRRAAGRAGDAARAPRSLPRRPQRARLGRCARRVRPGSASRRPASGRLGRARGSGRVPGGRQGRRRTWARYSDRRRAAVLPAAAPLSLAFWPPAISRQAGGNTSSNTRRCSWSRTGESPTSSSSTGPTPTPRSRASRRSARRPSPSAITPACPASSTRATGRASVTATPRTTSWWTVAPSAGSRCAGRRRCWSSFAHGPSSCRTSRPGSRRSPETSSTSR